MERMIPVLLVMVLCTAFSRCGRDADRPEQPPERAERIDLEEGEKLVRELVFARFPGMNPEARFPLKEITTDADWDRMQAQLFTVTGDSPRHGCVYLIKKGKAIHLAGPGNGGYMNSSCVADLDGDGAPELLYTYGAGSGLHWSRVAAFLEDPSGPHLVHADLSYDFGDLHLDRRGDREVCLELRDWNLNPGMEKDRIPLGTLMLEKGDPGYRLEILLAEGLPPEIGRKVKEKRQR